MHACGQMVRIFACLMGLLALFAYCANAHAFDCFPSADALRRQYPEAWPLWTLRAPGHAGARCWYASTRSTAHHRPKWTAAPDAAPRMSETLETPERNSEFTIPSRSDTPSPSVPVEDAPTTAPLTDSMTTQAISNENRPAAVSTMVPPTAAGAVNPELGQRANVAEPVAVLPQAALPLKYSIDREPARVTDQAFSTRALLGVFGGAPVFASMIAGMVARFHKAP
jgi:hypothetical protein